MTLEPKMGKHDSLVIRAVQWLKGTAKCGLAVPELVTWCPEQPDAMGWTDRGAVCILIECKVTRADFLADKKKHFRKVPATGAGNRRYYMTYPGLIDPDELPKNWGLLEVHDKIVRKVRESGKFDHPETVYLSVHFMYSLLRRCEIRGSIGRCLSNKWKCG